MGQLFDPEWVQQNRPARVWLMPLDRQQQQCALDGAQAVLEAARRARRVAKAKASAARSAVTRAAASAAMQASRTAATAHLKVRGYGAITTEILKLLRDAPQGLRHGAFVKALGGVRLAGHLRAFLDRGLVLRSGELRAFVYAITEKGRAHLAEASKALDGAAAVVKAARLARRVAKAQAAALATASTRAASQAATTAARASSTASLKERGYGAKVTEILQQLRGAPDGLSHGALVKALGGVRVAAHLKWLLDRGLVLRSGVHRAYLYTINSAKAR